jgi:hypothetical protein
MNYRNGFIKKKVDTLFGTIELDIPRDRKNIVSNSLILSKLLYPFSHYITYLYSNGLSISNIRFFLHLFLGYDYSYFQMKKNITYCLINHTLIREKENDFGYKTILINIYTLKNSFDSFIFFLSKHENSYHVIGFYKVIDDLNASFAFALDNLNYFLCLVHQNHLLLQKLGRIIRENLIWQESILKFLLMKGLML